MCNNTVRVFPALTRHGINVTRPATDNSVGKFHRPCVGLAKRGKCKQEEAAK